MADPLEVHPNQLKFLSWSVIYVFLSRQLIANRKTHVKPMFFEEGYISSHYSPALGRGLDVQRSSSTP